jgi:hypothetical protein
MFIKALDLRVALFAALAAAVSACASASHTGGSGNDTTGNGASTGNGGSPGDGPCVPECGGLECGLDPKCGAPCGTCTNGDACVDGHCECAPACNGRHCGPDPQCGASCGTCPSGDACVDGQCECVPDCAGRECGLDPKCGQSCGTCAVGDSCNGGICVTPPPPTTATLCWTVNDQCFNGETIEYKLFDSAKNWVWPSATTHWNISGGQSEQQCITCTPGDKICFGGNQPVHNIYWGVGFTDTYACTACCFTCADASVALGPITCN